VTKPPEEFPLNETIPLRSAENVIVPARGAIKFTESLKSTGLKLANEEVLRAKVPRSIGVLVVLIVLKGAPLNDSPLYEVPRSFDPR